MIKCIYGEPTHDAEETMFVILNSTEAPTGKTTGEGIDAMPDRVAIADGSYCEDLANKKTYRFLAGTWYER